MIGEDVLAPKVERRSQAERRDEAEQRLLAAAVRLVGERGLERITLSEVGEAAGYSRGLPAHYFGGKSGMVVSLVQHIIDGFGRALLRAEHHDLGMDRLLGTVAFYFKAARRDPIGARALSVLLVEGLNNDLVADRLAALNARSAGAFEANLAAAVAAGEVRADIDVKAQAILILATLRGVVGQWLLAPHDIDLAAVSAAFITALRRSLVP
ncbi:MAG: TetR/AcrR family transcriptional regulator [Caulobacterales bacterium]